MLNRSTKVSKYAQNVYTNETANISTTSSNIFSSILPFAIRVAAKTIANGDISLLKEAEVQVIAENRDKQIDSILNDSEYIPTKLENTEKYKEYLSSVLLPVKPISAPSGVLFYLDVKYDDKSK